ncbi:hypothetical protein ACODT5_28605 [Streptomyces sp. 5.8]|uniref:hypothetical protein n=1 Tax=Streptomyces sp. 5.8 TaxID=3406571 RepID=UPI003BB6A408
MSSESSNPKKTVRMNAADLRTQIVKVLGARVQYGKEHIQVMRYKEAQAVIVPLDWYEKALEALAEQDRLPAEPDPNDT